ncbi:hypothetical protein [Streptomyces cyaneofuscatus]|uniref:Lipoprotein n=1 Tax=Streptomyces cyaneofuscatus TaxID=66883 RepID=A0ABZ1EZD6_9ACTN|nr:hypothetical protein [Streptomyces cyaneofuscatus]WSB09520.1 hypothetical protein OG849_20940 [Streptomyces cyaneofuscatus]WSD46945.1 hypothetical protein OG857_14465 [Streptomyces cyaneofuscatus]WTA90344.1 hypothetical protein OG323_15605 [Streptomyces cyaneofuscatus]
MFGNRNRRKALLASAALVGGALLMTACQDTDGSVDSGAAQSGSPSAVAGSPSASEDPEDAASDAPTDEPSGAPSDVAFGSDGTEAGPVEQSVGKPVTLSGSKVAYAGVNPKTTNTDGGKELGSIIVAVGNEDPNPVSLKVGTITVDKPVVTNWHTAPKDAVPFN